VSLHRTRNAKHTYRWNSEKASPPSACARCRRRSARLGLDPNPAAGSTRRERWTHEIRVPHAHDVLDAQLAHEEAVHPPERKLDELDALLLEVCGEWSCGRGRRGVSVEDSKSMQSLRALLREVPGATRL